MPPIHLATTFERDPDNRYRSGNVKGRPDNETVREAEAVIGALEGASATLVFGSGMSAAIALFLSLGPGPSDRARRDVLGPAQLALERGPAFGSASFRRYRGFAGAGAGGEAGRDEACMARDAQQSAVGRERYRSLGRIAHGAGAAVAVDSTCATPIFTRPIALGAES